MDEETQANPNAVWCVVANIIHEHTFGQERDIVRGTKQFLPGAKVYCAHFQDWDDPPQVRVVGRHRKSKRFSLIRMRMAYLANWRVELVYSPTVIQLLNEHANYIQRRYVDQGFSVGVGFHNWDGSEESRLKAEAIVNGPWPEKFGAGSQPFITREKSPGEES